MECARALCGDVDRYPGFRFRMNRPQRVEINRADEEARKQRVQRAFPTESRRRKGYREITIIDWPVIFHRTSDSRVYSCVEPLRNEAELLAGETSLRPSRGRLLNF